MWRAAGADDRRRTRSLPARAVPHSSCRRAAPRQYTQHARNPARNVEIGGTQHGLRAELRLAVRLRPGPRPPVRDDRRLPEHRQAHLHRRRTCITRAARCASPSTYPSTSGTSTWCTPTSSTATRPSWARSPPASGRPTRSRLARIAFGGDLARPHRHVVAHQRLVPTRLGTTRCWPRPRPMRRPTRRASSLRSSFRWRHGPDHRGRPSPHRRSPRRLAGMAFCQLVRPGAPVIFGSFASSMSMATGAPTFGTPEPAIVLYTVCGPRSPPRRPVPLGRLAHRLQAARCTGRVRVGVDDHSDRHGGRQLRAPRGGLDGGRPRRRLREVHDGCRPARHDDDARPRAST